MTIDTWPKKTIRNMFGGVWGKNHNKQKTLGGLGGGVGGWGGGFCGRASQHKKTHMFLIFANSAHKTQKEKETK